jgi:hypothetical protein
MRSKVFFSFLFLLGSFIGQGKSQQGFDKAAFYAAMSSENVDLINTQIAAVKGSSVPEKEAYEGALLMKKAGLNKAAKEKLKLFKSGRSKLESSITKDNNNTEYRFLRLIIQEHAPKVVKYRNEVEQDSRLIRTNFKQLPQYLQQVIIDYSKTSKVLKI